MMFHEGETLQIEKQEGWEPKAPVVGIVVRCIEDKRGNPSYVIKSDDSSFFALTSHFGKEEHPVQMGFHILKSDAEIPDPEWPVGFVSAAQIKP